jgi:hypothetical protein
MKKNILFSLFVLAVAFSSCGKDVDCTEQGVSEAIADELAAVLSATFLYYDNPSEDNCKKLKSATEDYIDVVKDLEDCAKEMGELEDFQESLKEAQDSLDDLPC